MKILKTSFLFISLLFFLENCRTIRELKNFSKCEFRVKDISELNLNGLNVKNIKSLSDFSLADAGRLGLAFKSGSLPLNITYDLEVKNPHDKLAALEKLDWILEVDNKDFVNGTTERRVEIQPNGGQAILPISVGMDIRKALQKESLESILNLMAGISNTNQEESRIRLKIKPRFIIAGLTLGYPGYIKVGATFKGANDAAKTNTN